MQFTVRADDEDPLLFDGRYTFHPSGVLEICADDGRCLFVAPRWWLEVKEVAVEKGDGLEPADTHEEPVGGFADLVRGVRRRLRLTGVPSPACSELAKH